MSACPPVPLFIHHKSQPSLPLKEPLQDLNLAWHDGDTTLAVGYNRLLFGNLIRAQTRGPEGFSSENCTALPRIIFTSLGEGSDAIAGARPVGVNRGNCEVEQRWSVGTSLVELYSIRLIAVEVRHQARVLKSAVLQLNDVCTDHQDPQLIANLPCCVRVQIQTNACFPRAGLHFQCPFPRYA